MSNQAIDQIPQISQIPQYDVIVCGAGPSGSVAAAEAAKAGLKVALLEKQFLPRHKTCGGGMPMVMQDFLWDMAPEAFVESNVSFMRHTWNFEDAYMGLVNPPGQSRQLSLWMVQRPIFDNALAERAVRAGAQLRDGLAIRSLDVQPDGVIVQAQDVKTGASWTGKARYIIGADGANGVVVRSTKLRQDRAIAVALEVEVPYDWSHPSHPDLRPEVVHLEFGAVKRGYAWIFPKADHLNIGAGIFRPDKKDGRREQAVRSQLQATIFDYMDAVGVKYDRETIRFHGHPLPTWAGKEPLHEGRILLVGDAAGLINPLFGDGILHAVKSGQIAAMAIAEDAADSYTNRIHAEFGADFDAALQLSRVFYNWTNLCYKYGVKSERSTRLATQLLCGELKFTEMSGRAIRRLKQKAGEKLFPAFNF